MGANSFAFFLNEATLRRALQKIEQETRQYQGQHFGLEVSIDLIPDGVGYEARNLKVLVVGDEQTSCLEYLASGPATNEWLN